MILLLSDDSQINTQTSASHCTKCSHLASTSLTTHKVTLFSHTHTHKTTRQKRTTGTQIIIARAPLSIADSVRQNQWSCSPLARMRLSCLSLSQYIPHHPLTPIRSLLCVQIAPLKCQKNAASSSLLFCLSVCLFFTQSFFSSWDHPPRCSLLPLVRVLVVLSYLGDAAPAAASSSSSCASPQASAAASAAITPLPLHASPTPASRTRSSSTRKQAAQIAAALTQIRPR